MFQNQRERQTNTYKQLQKDNRWQTEVVALSQKGGNAVTQT